MGGYFLLDYHTYFIPCARGGNRTRIPEGHDFKSCVYTNSTTRAMYENLSENMFIINKQRHLHLRPRRDLHPRMTVLQTVALTIFATWSGFYYFTFLSSGNQIFGTFFAMVKYKTTYLESLEIFHQFVDDVFLLRLF